MKHELLVSPEADERERADSAVAEASPGVEADEAERVEILEEVAPPQPPAEADEAEKADQVIGVPNLLEFFDEPDPRTSR